MPAMTCSSVVLPQPLWPTSTTCSPAATAEIGDIQHRQLRAVRLPERLLQVFQLQHVENRPSGWIVPAPPVDQSAAHSLDYTPGYAYVARPWNGSDSGTVPFFRHRARVPAIDGDVGKWRLSPHARFRAARHKRLTSSKATLFFAPSRRRGCRHLLQAHLESSSERPPSTGSVDSGPARCRRGWPWPTRGGSGGGTGGCRSAAGRGVMAAMPVVPRSHGSSNVQNS